MFQQLTLVGHLGGDPELRHTASGVPVASFSIAVSRSWVGQDGQRQEKTTWFRVSAWRKLAETVNQYLHKGSKALVICEIDEARSFTDRNGETRVSIDATASTIRFLDSRVEGESRGTGSAHTEGSQVLEASDIKEEDIPF